MQLFWDIEKKPTIMIEQIPQTDSFKQRLRESLRHETLNARTVRIARNADVYCCGDQEEMVYFIESGQIKLRVVSWEGKRVPARDPQRGRCFRRVVLGRFNRAA